MINDHFMGYCGWVGYTYINVHHIYILVIWNTMYLLTNDTYPIYIYMYDITTMYISLKRRRKKKEKEKEAVVIWLGRIFYCGEKN